MNEIQHLTGLLHSMFLGSILSQRTKFYIPTINKVFYCSYHAIVFKNQKSTVLMMEIQILGVPACPYTLYSIHLFQDMDCTLYNSTFISKAPFATFITSVYSIIHLLSVTYILIYSLGICLALLIVLN